MKLGFFTMPIHPVGRNYTQTLKEDREAVLLADRLGYSDAFIGEHVTDVCESIPSCLAFIASVAHDTKQIRLGSGTVNLPNQNPAQVAATVAMVDHMLEGRFLFGIGPGGLRSDMEVMGNLELDRNAMFVEAIDQILAIWAGDAPYNIKGKFWNISTERTLSAGRGQGVMVKPIPETAPADRGVGGGAVLEGGRSSGEARLDADYSQLPATGMGGDALSDVREGLCRGRTPR